MLTRNSEATESPVSAADLVLIGYLSALAAQVAGKIECTCSLSADNDGNVRISAASLMGIAEELRAASEDGFDLFKKLAQDVMPSYSVDPGFLEAAE